MRSDAGWTKGGREAKGEGDAALVEVLRDQVAHLKEQLDAERRANDENRRLLAGLIERVPALEAPTDTSAPTQRHEVGTQEPAEAAPTPALPGPGTTPRTDEPR